MYLDIFLLVVILLAAYSGWKNGFVKELLSIGGVIGGILIACIIYYFASEYLYLTGPGANMTTNIIAFIVLCLVVPFALSFLANGLTKLVREIHLGIFNSIAGCALSVIKYVLILSFAFNIMEFLHIMNREYTADSRLYGAVTSALPFVRDAAKQKYESTKEKAVEAVESTSADAESDR